MSILHSHHHPDHEGHSHDEEHSAHHESAPPGRRSRLPLRLIIAGALVLFVFLSACLVQVPSGEALVVTRFGNPTRVLMTPGLAWRLPVPLEAVVPVDLRVRSTSSGLEDVGTRDGLRVIVQAYVVWRVQADGAHVERFLRAVQNQPDEAARQIRAFLGSALETSTSAFELSKLVNTDAKKVEITGLEEKLRSQVNPQLLATYGVSVVSVGIERLTLPAVTLAATVDRMRAERETIAAERTAVGNRQAAEIRSTAEKDARIVEADAKVKAAEIESESRVAAASIYGKAYAASPPLYNMVRSLDTLSNLFTPETKLILRTDAAPFRALIDGPPSAEGAKASSERAGR